MNYGTRIAEVVSKLIRKSIPERDRISLLLFLVHHLFLFSHSPWLIRAPAHRHDSRHPAVFSSHLSEDEHRWSVWSSRKARRRHVGQHLVTFRVARGWSGATTSPRSAYSPLVVSSLSFSLSFHHQPRSCLPLEAEFSSVKCFCVVPILINLLPLGL